ncbi:transcriptional regulator TACO1-like protein [Roridomyces roridus]|uniref:Transcriptional regulator TACO1-like protein n=1 Tax=Roridomyces roridus TaxID=1738132 RepID=A0AAD7FQC8_9AGAR|nr:transcriptional regulator TACO1-like protein [Roridomyces roridus]
MTVKRMLRTPKASRDILTAVRLGGSADPEKNSTLAAILRRLKDIPKENIQNALEKAAKRRELRGEEIIYEALAYNTVGLIIECTTDNPTRTFANIRQILNEHSTRMAPVRFMFERKGIVKVLASKEREDHESHLENLVETALSNGAVDLDEISSTKTEVEMEFTCVPEDLGKLTTALTAPGVSQTLLASEIVFAPMESTVAEDPELPTKIADLVRELEEDEDLKRVWSSL